MPQVNAKQLDNAKMVSNILAVFNAVYERSDANEFLAMGLWYESANKFCAQTARVFNLSVETVAGIVAALSPQLNWDKNKFNAVTLIAALVSNSPLPKLMAYPANVQKAIAIFNGQSPLDVLGENGNKITGKKVQSFYRNIMGYTEYVTIDRHATDIAMFGLQGENHKSGDLGPTPKAYDMIADAYRHAAQLLDLPPSTVQCITWTFKAQNGGKAN